MEIRSSLSLIGLLLATAIGATTAQAATFHSNTDADCNNYVATKGDIRDFAITLDGDADCVLSGTGNIEGEDSEVASLIGNWEFLDKDPSSGSSGTGEWTINNVSGVDASSGTITLDSNIWSLYDSLAIGLKSGNNESPTWVIFLLSNTTDTTIDFSLSQNGLSHANLYGIPSAVPVPAALGLFGLGLAGLGFIRQRKQKKAA